MTTVFNPDPGIASRNLLVESPEKESTTRHFVLPPDMSVGRRATRPRPSRSRRARGYLRGYLRALRFVDVVVVALAVGLAHLGRFGLGSQAVITVNTPTSLGYWAVSGLLVLGWLVLLHFQDAYDGRVSGHGVQEYRAVFGASMQLFSVLAIVSFVFRLDFARGYVMIAFPLGTVLLLSGRWTARRWLVRQRAQGRLADRVLLVGDREDLTLLIRALHRTPSAGYNVVGACVEDAPGSHIGGVEIVGGASAAVMQALDMDIDVVAVSSSGALGSEGLRRLGWALENTDIELVVAPGIMDVAGPRVKTRPVQGLPLLHVEAPTFAGPQLIVKRALDRAAAALGIVVMAPILGLLAALVFFQDRGPVLFAQERIGRNGVPFKFFKFRSMAVDSEVRLAELMDQNEGAGPLFKLRDDPRVTRVGAYLRKYSLDELPQLFNVLRGEMSLVGPRPPLPREVAEYEDDAHRRLFVKPGMTGLWQISGRSDLSWEETVRLDLYYVENWSPLLDLLILWRTVQVVVSPDKSGAY